MRTYAYIAALSALCLCLAGCDFGEVDQGRCVAYDAGQKSFTLVLDVNHEINNPSYTGGVHTYTVPSDPSEMGPEPVPGGLVQLLPDKKEVVICVNGELQNVPVEFLAIDKGIKEKDEKVKGKSFPVIDKDALTVTEYYPRLQELVTVKVPAELIDLPPETWNAGDECRIYYKENAKHEVQRFMNVSQTNIFKR